MRGLHSQSARMRTWRPATAAMNRQPTIHDTRAHLGLLTISNLPMASSSAVEKAVIFFSATSCEHHQIARINQVPTSGVRKRSQRGARRERD